MKRSDTPKADSSKSYTRRSDTPKADSDSKPRSDKPKQKFRVRLGSVQGRHATSQYAYDSTIAESARTAQQAMKLTTKFPTARILDVEELVGHTWMMRARWTKRNAKAKWEKRV